jgi:hypothetical protein
MATESEKAPSAQAENSNASAEAENDIAEGDVGTESILNITVVLPRPKDNKIKLTVCLSIFNSLSAK